MSNPNADKNRVGSELSRKVLGDVAGKATSSRGRRPAPKGLMTSSGSQVRMRRLELLDLKIAEDEKRWQMIHNDPERYEIVACKFSMVRANHYVDYTCLLVYDELGEDLPPVKSAYELRAQDDERMRTMGFEPPDMHEGREQPSNDDGESEPSFTLDE